MATLREYREAVARCLANPADYNDLITSESLREALESGSSAKQIEMADEWFNKPQPLLPQFMQRYGFTPSVVEENVHLILGARRMTDSAMAELLGVSRQRVVSMLDKPTQAIVTRIAGALSVPAEWLTDEHLADKSARELRGE